MQERCLDRVFRKFGGNFVNFTKFQLVVILDYELEALSTNRYSLVRYVVYRLPSRYKTVGHLPVGARAVYRPSFWWILAIFQNFTKIQLGVIRDYEL